MAPLHQVTVIRGAESSFLPSTCERKTPASSQGNSEPDNGSDGMGLENRRMEMDERENRHMHRRVHVGDGADFYLEFGLGKCGQHREPFED